MTDPLDLQEYLSHLTPEEVIETRRMLMRMRAMDSVTRFFMMIVLAISGFVIFAYHGFGLYQMFHPPKH